MTETEKKVPELRFNGFFEDWEQRKLIEEADFFDEKRIPIDSEKRVQGRYPYYGATGVIDYVDNYIFDGEYILLAEDGANIITRNSPVAYITEGKFWLNNHAHIMKMKLGSNLFLLQLLERQNYEKFNSGTAQPKLNGQIVKNMIFKFPSYKEQNKIGNFFKLIDDAIALHLCKQHQLEALKQSLIKEILPQNDSVFPSLRFANFNKPWEHYQLKEVLKINSGRDYKHLNEGDIPVYGTGGYMLSVDGKLSNVDGIGLGRKGTIDKPQYLKAPFWTVDTLFYLTPFPNHDIYFLFTLTQSINWKTMDESTGVPSLSKAVIEKVTRTFPSLVEQQKIGSFFKQLDETISHHQQKIDNMQSLKRTLLNKMFI